MRTSAFEFPNAFFYLDQFRCSEIRTITHIINSFFSTAPRSECSGSNFVSSSVVSPIGGGMIPEERYFSSPAGGSPVSCKESGKDMGWQFRGRRR